MIGDAVPGSPSNAQPDASWHEPAGRAKSGLPGADIGNFFLAEKAAGEACADEDEKVPARFASPVASAMTNAHVDLEALIKIAPVGVVALPMKGRSFREERGAAPCSMPDFGTAATRPCMTGAGLIPSRGIA